MTKKVENEILIPEMAELLAEGKDVCFTPSGVSMRPYIEGGRDSVTLRKVANVRVGDIVLAAVSGQKSEVRSQQSEVRGQKSAGGHYVLHRVIAVDGEQVTLQGDGNLSGTEQCTTADVLGTVVRIETPRGRRKLLTRGRLWYRIRGGRKWWLKIYRKLLRLGLLG